MKCHVEQIDPLRDRVEILTLFLIAHLFLLVQLSLGLGSESLNLQAWMAEQGFSRCHSRQADVSHQELGDP
jgi:hypothetical protein